MTDYSKQSKDEKPEDGEEVKPKLEKVVKGPVKEKKPGLGRRFKEVFFGGEFKGAAEYIAADVLLPALRNAMVDAVTNGIERIVYGDRRQSPPPAGRYAGRVNYQGYSSMQQPAPRSRIIDARSREANLPDQPSRPTSRHGRPEFILATREEADDVIEALQLYIDKYESVALSDLKDLLGEPTNPVESRWGWTSLLGVQTIQVRNGWVLSLPVPEEL